GGRRDARRDQREAHRPRPLAGGVHPAHRLQSGPGLPLHRGAEPARALRCGGDPGAARGPRAAGPGRPRPRARGSPGRGCGAEAVAETLGETSERHIAHDRSLVEFTRLTVSNPDLASRSIAELNLPVRFGAVVTRVRRGDLELLARDDLVLEPGDRLAVVVER